MPRRPSAERASASDHTISSSVPCPACLHICLGRHTALNLSRMGSFIQSLDIAVQGAQGGGRRRVLSGPGHHSSTARVTPTSAARTTRSFSK